jgi:hypothetical protein
MNIIYDSPLKKFANQKLDWLPWRMDSITQYNNHLSTKYDELARFNWIDAKFTYSFNSHGFRCEEFADTPTAMFLGCSYTFGTGLPIETTWAYLTAQKLNLKLANLGIGGAALDTSFRLCHGWIDKIKPSIIFLLPPDTARHEMFHENGDVHIALPSQIDNLDEISKPFYKRWLMVDTNAYMNAEKNQLAIEQMCSVRKIKLVTVSLEDYFLSKIDLARDLTHNGIISNYNLSQTVLNKL